MTVNTEYQHFKLNLDKQGILWVGFDRHESAVNSLSHSVLSELGKIIDEIANDSAVKSVIFYSAKKTGFIAGADISQFTEINSSEEAFALIRQGQQVFEKLATLPVPTVAMIDGNCLGGGFEFALACRYRVAEDSHTSIGLPEVHLGLQPGWLGTVRLPLLIGAPKALKLILTGKIITSKEAEKLGAIDSAVPRRVLEKAAVYFALSQPQPHKPTFVEYFSNHGIARHFLAKIFAAKLKQRVNEEHYPAPYAILKNWEELGPESPQAVVQEARSISELMVHPTARNLVRVFFLKQRLKSLAKGLNFKAKHVHVIGAGTMGSAIAAQCALSGLTVTLQDQSPKFIAAGIKKGHNIIKGKLKSRREVALAMDRLNPDITGLGVAKADVVIEAIVEDLPAKHKLYREIEPKMKADALLATNTSSLPLADLGKALKSPEKLVGIHFFNPVEKMELVEVVSDPTTNAHNVDKALAFVKQINRLPLPVLSKPGFLVNRILMPYLLESMTLLQEGIPAPIIDKAAKDFGMPMGPIELADRVGLDVCLSVADILTHHLGGEVPDELRNKVAAGQLGAKTGEGFYRYQNNKPLRLSPINAENLKISVQDLQDRLILRMLNEAVACLRESIVADADLLDAGMIFGTGFAPFLGGPIHYAKDRGVTQVYQRLESLAEKFGNRFQPDAGWQMLTLDSNVAMPLPEKKATSGEDAKYH